MMGADQCVCCAGDCAVRVCSHVFWLVFSFLRSTSLHKHTQTHANTHTHTHTENNMEFVLLLFLTNTVITLINIFTLILYY